MNVLAIVPARGGSKGIPRKNLLPLNGHPLIAYAVSAAKDSHRVARVLCSTDDEEIAAAARRYGAEVPFIRPAELAQDLSTDIEVFQHALAWLQQHEGYVPDVVINMRSTSPLRRHGDLDRCLDLMAQPGTDSVRSICPAPATAFKMWFRQDDDRLRQLLTLPGLDEPYNMPRQILPQVWWQTGHYDLVSASVVRDRGQMSGEVIRAFEVSAEDSVDIDTPADYERITTLIKEKNLWITPAIVS